MSAAFTRMPVAPLPERALVDTDALYRWAQPLMLRVWSEPYWDQVYFFLCFKVALTTVSSILMVRLLRLGVFWVIRPVRVKRGTILVPKATDATIFLGATFIIVDAAYRFMTIRWFRGPTYVPVNNYMLLEGLRLYPAWLTGWVHLCASSLVWPLQLDTIRPLYWHLGFFGVPVLFLATFVPAMVVGDRIVEQAQVVYLALEQELLAAPGQPVTQWMKDQALQTHVLLADGAYWIGVWALVGAIFSGLIFVGEVIVGSTLLSRVYAAYSQIPVDTPSHHTWSTLEEPAESVDTMVAPRTPSPQPIKPKISRLRMAKYLAGVAPLASTASEVLEPLPPAVTRRILRTFFFHSLTELIGIAGIPLVLFSIAIYIAARGYIDMRENTYDATYGNTLGRTNYTFHVIEIWAVIVLGSSLTISMLKRQAFPLHVPRLPGSKGAARGFACPRKQESRVPLVELTAARSEAAKQAETRSDNKLNHKRTFSSLMPPLWLNSATPSPDLLSCDTLAPSQSRDSVMSLHTLADSKHSAREAFESVVRPPLANSSTSSPVAPAEEDVSWYAGHGTGRSIVLSALASSSDLGAARGSKAAWRTQGNESRDTDLEAGVSARKYATELGIMETPSPKPPRTPTSSSFFSSARFSSRQAR